jgi:hypothetical protein
MNVLTDVRLHQAYNVLKQFMYVQWLFVRRAARAKQSVYERRKAIGFADDDAGVFPQLVAFKLPFEELRRAAQATERIFDLVRELADHLPARAMLDYQSVFPTDFRASRYVIHFDEQCILELDGRHRRNAAIDDPVFRVRFTSAETEFVRVRDAGHQCSHQDIA